MSRCDQLITDVTNMIRQGYHIEVGIQVFMFLRLSSPRPAPEPYMPKPEPPLAPIPEPEPKAFLTCTRHGELFSHAEFFLWYSFNILDKKSDTLR